MTRTISIDRRRPLAQEPGTGHNRWHPDIPPVVEVAEGEEVLLETRDALDGSLTPASTVADFPGVALGAVHPLAGPVHVKDARPGDLLEIEFVDIRPEPWGFSAIMPGLGFLRDVMTTPFLVHWTLAGGWATSPQLPGVRVPAAAFHGRVRRGSLGGPGRSLDPPGGGGDGGRGLRAPSRRRGGGPRVGPARGPRPPDAAATGERRELRRQAAHPGSPPPAAGQRARGPLLHRRRPLGPGGRRGVRDRGGDGGHLRGALPPPAGRGRAPPDPLAPVRAQRLFHRPRLGRPRRFVATMGMPVDAQGVNHGESLSLACRNAVLTMMDLLQERGFNREQAYVICQRGRGPQDQQCRRPPQRDRLGLPAPGGPGGLSRVDAFFLHVDPEPLYVALLMVAMMLTTELGYHVGRAWSARVADGAKSQASVMIGATLGLLALLVPSPSGIAAERRGSRCRAAR